MNTMNKSINWIVLITQMGHVFCCGLPMVFSVMSLIAGVGVAMPVSLEFFHHAVENYEGRLLVFSAMIVCVGWVLHYIGTRFDCHSTGCHHGSCAPTKKRSDKILMVATCLFLVNSSFYFFIHH